MEDRTEWRQRVTGSRPWTGGGKTFNKSEPEYDCQSVGHSWSTFQMILPRKKLLMLAPTWKCSAAISKAQSISTVGKSCYQENTTISWSRRSEHQTKQDFFLLRVSDRLPFSQLILHEADTLKSQKRQNHSVSMPRLKKKLINQTKSKNKLISVRGGGVRTTTISE